MTALAPLIVAASLSGPVVAPSPKETVVLASRVEVRAAGDWKLLPRRRPDGTQVFLFKVGDVAIEVETEIRIVFPNGEIHHYERVGDKVETQITPPPGHPDEPDA